MRAWYSWATRNLRSLDIDDPTPGVSEVVVEVKASGSVGVTCILPGAAQPGDADGAPHYRRA